MIEITEQGEERRLSPDEPMEIEIPAAAQEEVVETSPPLLMAEETLVEAPVMDEEVENSGVSTSEPNIAVDRPATEVDRARVMRRSRSLSLCLNRSEVDRRVTPDAVNRVNPTILQDDQSSVTVTDAPPAQRGRSSGKSKKKRQTQEQEPMPPRELELDELERRRAAEATRIPRRARRAEPVRDLVPRHQSEQTRAWFEYRSRPGGTLSKQALNLISVPNVQMDHEPVPTRAPGEGRPPTLSQALNPPQGERMEAENTEAEEINRRAMDRHTEGWTDGAGEYVYRMAEQLEQDVTRHRAARTWQIVPVLSLSTMLRMDQAEMACLARYAANLRDAEEREALGLGLETRRIQRWGRERCDGACFAPRTSSYPLIPEMRIVYVIAAARAPILVGMGIWKCKRTKWRHDPSHKDSGPAGRGLKPKSSWSRD